MSVDADFTELKERLKTIEDLHGAERALIWDQSTYMPPNAVEARGRQLALLAAFRTSAWPIPPSVGCSIR